MATKIDCALLLFTLGVILFIAKTTSSGNITYNNLLPLKLSKNLHRTKELYSTPDMTLAPICCINSTASGDAVSNNSFAVVKKISSKPALSNDAFYYSIFSVKNLTKPNKSLKIVVVHENSSTISNLSTSTFSEELIEVFGSLTTINDLPQDTEYDNEVEYNYNNDRGKRELENRYENKNDLVLYDNDYGFIKDLNITIKEIRRRMEDQYRKHNVSWCRMRDGIYLPPELFAWHSCAHCYKFEVLKRPLGPIPWVVIDMPVQYDNETFLISTLINITDNSHMVNADLNADEIFNLVWDDKFRSNWRSCCKGAVRCCKEFSNLNEEAPPNFCPRTWDGWQCWGGAPPDSVASAPCPSHSYIETVPFCVKFASKKCLPDGTWFRRGGTEWSDYSSCGHLKAIRVRFLCHIVALSTSIVALIPALLIFTFYRQLHVHRITLHKQLFTSLLLEAISSLACRLVQLYGHEITEQNPVWCITLTLTRQYTRQSTSMWYLCEGYYLHKLLATAFDKQRNLIFFYAFGWGVPVLLVGTYAALRGTLYQSAHCWNMPLDWSVEWILILPPLLAILINTLFLLNILRIIVGKMQMTPNDRDLSHFRVTARAILIVVPLFGLQYLVTIYRPVGGACFWIDAYHILNNVIEGCTGLILAIIFCYTNSEVKTLVRRSWSNFRDRHSNSMSGGLQRSVRLRSLSTVQTTLVDMNVPPNSSVKSIRDIQKSIDTSKTSYTSLSTNSVDEATPKDPINTFKYFKSKKALENKSHKKQKLHSISESDCQFDLTIEDSKDESFCNLIEMPKNIEDNLESAESETNNI